MASIEVLRQPHHAEIVDKLKGKNMITRIAMCLALVMACTIAWASEKPKLP